jgi:sec-independent protein translocase protein TatA
VRLQNPFVRHGLLWSNDTSKEFTVLLANLDGTDGIIVVVVLVVLVFGGSAIPKLARNLGSAQNEFEKGLKASKPEDSAASTSEAPTPASPASPPTSPPAATPPTSSTDPDSPH